MKHVDQLPVQPVVFDVEGWDAVHPENDECYRKSRRILRTYSRVAYKEHSCSRCNDPIRPGDMYDAEVWLYTGLTEGKKSKIVVRKYHYPMCPEMEREFEDEMVDEMHREDQHRADAA